ncbi:MAG: TetR/AcrR family transcriptional regulator [Hydrococcus sp. Prado102]|jgi:AcrR family transcriptional regulator|nr:TetR/AcrR family transcriptional regulator [Hydrococcus sp. Prado102]
MSKAEKTRENIIKQAAELFNRKGYCGSSISDIMKATGLQKGGIYNHFNSKDDLALQAFDYAYAIASKRVWEVVRKKTNAIERLQALVSVYLEYLDNPPVAGGCPILNTAIESDDTHPALRDRVRDAVNNWRSLICRIIQKGITKGEIKPSIDPDVIATIIISTVEGAIMMSKLYRDPIHLERAIAYLQDYIKNSL